MAWTDVGRFRFPYQDQCTRPCVRSIYLGFAQKPSLGCKKENQGQYKYMENVQETNPSKVKKIEGNSWRVLFKTSVKTVLANRPKREEKRENENENGRLNISFAEGQHLRDCNCQAPLCETGQLCPQSKYSVFTVVCQSLKISIVDYLSNKQMSEKCELLALNSCFAASTRVLSISFVRKQVAV